MSAPAKILLTHSYHLGYDRKQMRKMQPYLPLGTLYAAALLRENGFQVSVFDAMLREPLEGFRDALRKQQPRIVVLYEDDFNFLTKMCLTRMRELAFFMMEEARHIGARVIVHGSDATDHAREYLDRGCDFLLVGESETTLLHIVQELSAGREPSALPGVLRHAGQPVAEISRVRRSRPVVSLPLPARDLIDVAPYREAWTAAHGSFSMNIVASRGCPFRCNWCAKPIFGDTYNVRDAAEVAEEMAILKNVYGAQHLWFADDIFALSHAWVRAFSAEVQKRDAALPFKVQARADLLDAETVANLKRAGCAEIWMGVESGSQAILDAMEKGLRLEDVSSARRNLREHGIRACFFLQFGYPGESWPDLQKTIQLVRQLRPDDIGISFSYPLPDTRFYERVRSQLGAKQNWSDSEDLCVMFKGAYADNFYRAVRDALHAEVDSWHSANGPASTAAEIQRLWREVDRLEPVSRNSDATEPWDAASPLAASHVPRNSFIPLETFAAPQGRSK